MARKKTVSDEELKKLIEKRKKCQTKDKDEAKNKKKKRPEDIQLYRLKKNGLSYEDIVEYLAEEDGIEICLKTVANRIRKIFNEKGEKVPRAKRKPSKEPRKSKKRVQVSAQKLYDLKQKGMGYSAISKYLGRKGIKLCPAAVRKRIIEIYSERGEKIPRGKKGKNYTSPELIEAIWNLKNTRNASEEQMREIAKLYGVNLKRTAIKRTCDR